MRDCFIILLGILTAISFYAIVFHENIIEFIGKKLCKRGNHRFKKGKYYCKRCKAERGWPKLVRLEGGKIDRKLNFPKI